MEGRASFSLLPDELQLSIFERLFRPPGGPARPNEEGGDLIRAMQVCRHWLRLCTSDELWQVAYLACVGRMTEEKERKIKASYYDLRHRLGEQEADGREAERNNATDEEPKERKRKRLMHWVKSHVSDEALHHHHHTQEPALSWRELTKARHLKAKKLAAIKLKPLEVPQGEVLLELVSNSEAPDGVLRVRYLNSADPNVAELSDTSRVTQADTPLMFLPPVLNQPSDLLLSYFETRIEDKGQRGYISIGIAPVNFDRRNIQAGWDPRSKSYGYHGDDGHKYPGLFDSAWNWMGEEYGPQFTTGDVVGCGVLVRRVTEEEVAERVKQALAKRASAWKKATSGPDAEILSLGGMVKKAEKAAAEAEGEETKAETPSEPDDSPQERLHFLLEWEEHKRKSLLSRATKALFGSKDRCENLASIFWTRNGQFLGLGYKDVVLSDADEHRATVGLHSPGETVGFNFGRFPFAFDVDDFMLNYPDSLGQPVPPAFKRAESETEEYSEDDLGSDDDEDIDATSDLEEIMSEVDGTGGDDDLDTDENSTSSGVGA